MGKRRGIGGSMVAPHPPSDGKLHPVEELAAVNGVSEAELAGLRRATGWAEGRQVTEEQFEAAVAQFESRPMGGGRI